MNEDGGNYNWIKRARTPHTLMSKLLAARTKALDDISWWAAKQEYVNI